MNRSSIIALVIGAMLFGCGAGMVAHEVWESEADAQMAWTGQKWEYHCSSFFNHPAHLTEPEGEATLNNLGAQGWELVQVNAGLGDMTVQMACFKRPLP